MTALVAEPRPSPIPIIKPESVFAPAHRAWTVGPWVHGRVIAKARQYLPPVAARNVGYFHAAPCAFSRALARAMFRCLIHDAVAGETATAGIGLIVGATPNLSLYE